MYTKIMAGVDEGPRARDAAALAEALAEATGADLLLVAAYPDPLLPFPLTVSRQGHRAEESRAVLHRVRPRYAPLAHTQTVADISPVRGLRRAVRDERPDLLVIGSSAKAPYGETCLGHTGRALLREQTCAIAVAAACVADEGVVLREIVVGVDGCPQSVAALAVARELAAGSGARLRVVGVVDDGLPPELWAINVIADISDWNRIVAARRTTLVDRLTTILGPAAAQDAELRTGSPAHELAGAAAGADLLVVGAHHHTAFDRFTLGSVSDALCSGAECSVLLVPG